MDRRFRRPHKRFGRRDKEKKNTLDGNRTYCPPSMQPFLFLHHAICKVDEVLLNKCGVSTKKRPDYGDILKKANVF
jgi:hypothetical protein